MRVGIVLNGEAPTAGELALLDACDRVVCADGGANAVLASGRVPDVIIGDMDSLERELLPTKPPKGFDLVELPRAKNVTDGEAALERVIAIGPGEVVILGGHGGGTGHFLANIGLLRRMKAAGIEAVMFGRGESISIVSAGETTMLPSPAGGAFSIIPLGGPATMTLHGTEFDSTNLTIGETAGRGLSNSVRRPPARLVVHEGSVLLVGERR